MEVETAWKDVAELMTGIVETVAGRAVAEAVKPLIDRFRKSLARRGFGASNIFIILERSKTPKSSSFTALAEIWDLPAGLNQRDVEKAVKSSDFQSMCREMVAAQIAGATPLHRRKLKARLEAILDRDLRPERMRPERLESYASKMFDDLFNTCGVVATELTSSVEAPLEVLNWAREVVTGDVLNSIDTHLATANEYFDSTEDPDWMAAYRRAFEERHSNIDVPDFSGRYLAAYGDLFVAPRMEELTIRLEQYRSQQTSTARAKTIQFKTFVRQLDRCVLLGDPGAGKSTSSTIAALESLVFGKIPFIVTLRSVPSVGFEVCGYLSDVLKVRYQMNVDPGAVRAVLASGRALIVFDGLDEILHNSDRTEMTRTIESISYRYPFAAILVTCRRIGYPVARLNGEKFSEFRILPLTLDQVSEYAKNWFALQSDQFDIDSTILATDFTASAASMLDLVENPLLLSFICVLYRGRRSVPRNRPELYRRCVELLLEWDDIRRISETSHDVADSLVALSRIASIDAGGGLTAKQIEADLIPFLAEHATGSDREARRIVLQLLSVCRGRAWLFTDVGLTEDYQDIFSFTHASFREYLAALYLVRNIGDPRALAERLYEAVVTGSAQIFLQICLWLFDSRVQAGASATVQQLARIIKERNPAVDEPGSSRIDSLRVMEAERTRRAIAIRSITDAADCVGLSRATVLEITNLILDQIGQGDLVSAIMVLDSNYRHGIAAREALLKRISDMSSADDILELRALWFVLHLGSTDSIEDQSIDVPLELVEALRRSIRENTALLRQLTMRSEMFEIAAIQSGGLDVSYFAPVHSEQVISQAFTAYMKPLSIGPETLADWVLDGLSRRQRIRTDISSIIRYLRMIERKVRDDDRLPLNVPLPMLSQTIKDGDTRLERAMERIMGYPIECRDGLAYLGAAAISLHHQNGIPEPAGVDFSRFAVSQSASLVLDEWRRSSSQFWLHSDMGSG